MFVRRERKKIFTHCGGCSFCSFLPCRKVVVEGAMGEETDGVVVAGGTPSCRQQRHVRHQFNGFFQRRGANHKMSMQEK